MNSYDSPTTGQRPLTVAGDADAITTDLERTRTEFTEDVDAPAGKTDPRTRIKQAVGAARDKATAAAARTRDAAPRRLRANPKPAAAAILLVVAGAAGTILARRRAAKARAARGRWSRLTRR
jgi:hypothetical protein